MVCNRIASSLSRGRRQRVKKADRLRAECRQRAEVALANVWAAQRSTLEMGEAAPSVVVHLLDTVQSALRSAMAELES